MHTLPIARRGEKTDDQETVGGSGGGRCSATTEPRAGSHRLLRLLSWLSLQSWCRHCRFVGRWCRRCGARRLCLQAATAARRLLRAAASVLRAAALLLLLRSMI